MWGRKGMAKLKAGLIEKNVAKLAPRVGKEAFLEQLRVQWASLIKKDCNIDEEVSKARERINHSGPFRTAFDKVGITDEDLRIVITKIKEEKPVQIINEAPKPGRNEPCPCGSGKKYKKCCGG